MASNASLSSDEVLDSLREELKNLTVEEASLKKELAIKDMEQRIKDKKRNIQRLRNELDASTVAFTAKLTKQLTGLGNHQTLIFDCVITNVGKAYNSTTGIFTTPVSGVYGFIMDIYQTSGEHEYVELVKDGQHVMWNYAHAVGSQHNVANSRTLFLELDKGNQVWVRADRGSGKVWGNGFSSFSGWLNVIKD